MHHFGSLNDGAFVEPARYAGHAAGYAESALVNDTCGSFTPV